MNRTKQAMLEQYLFTLPLYDVIHLYSFIMPLLKLYS